MGGGGEEGFRGAGRRTRGVRGSLRMARGIREGIRETHGGIRSWFRCAFRGENGKSSFRLDVFHRDWNTYVPPPKRLVARVQRTLPATTTAGLW